VNTNPDYLVELPGGGRAVFEVKSFTRSPERDRVWNRSGYFTTSAEQEYGPIRSAIKAGAAQLKPLAGLRMPLVVVLANPPQPNGTSVMVLLDPMHVVSAMYGDLAVTAPVVGDRLGEFKPAATRDGQVARQHAHLSAVTVLYPRDDKFVVSIYDTPCYNATSLPEAALRGALNHRDGVFGQGDGTNTYGVRFTGPMRH
jgi:hypothetical protein